MRVTGINSEAASELWMTARKLAETLPGGKTERAWLDQAKRESWATRKATPAGRGRGATEFLVPSDVRALIDVKRVAEPAAAYEPHVTAAPEAAPEKETPVIDAATTALVTRCVEAAEKMLGLAHPRRQQISLGIDTFGMLRRMFPEKLHRLDAIPDADIEQLARFIYNARRAMEVARPDNIPPLV